jgi:DNA polymerase V
MQDFTRGTSPSRNALSAHFPQPSSDTPTIIQQAKKCLRILYKQAVPYKKVGILLLDLMPEEIEQFDLFADSLSDKKKSLAKTVDAINEQLGNKTVFYAAEGIGRQWQMKCGKRSPRYSTRWKELVVVKND